MEIIIVIVILIISLCFYFAIKKHKEESRKNIWVHSKTGNKYSIFLKCMIKNPYGKWVDGFIYHRLGEIDTMYVREFEDFVVNFVTLEDWEKDNGKDSR